MAIQDEVRLLTDAIEGLNLSIDCVAQSLSGRPRTGQKTTRGTTAEVQRKEIAKAHTTMLHVQSKLHGALRKLKADGRTLRPDAIHSGMAHHRAINSHKRLAHADNEDGFVVGDEVMIVHAQDRHKNHGRCGLVVGTTPKYVYLSLLPMRGTFSYQRADSFCIIDIRHHGNIAVGVQYPHPLNLV